MDEYIKVKDLVDMLEQRLVFQETHGFYRDAGYTSRFIESIADIPHINVAPKPEWISVDERLPEVETPVLIFTAKGRFYVGYYYKAAVDAKITGFYADACRRNVTHWMPLPEPPTEKEN